MTSRFRDLVTVSLMLCVCGCNKPSSEFTHQAKLAYQMLQAAQNHEGVSSQSFEEQMLKTKASISGKADQEEFNVLNSYYDAWNLAEDDQEDKRVVDLCHEAARKMFDPLGTFLPVSDLNSEEIASSNESICTEQQLALLKLKDSPSWKEKARAANIEKCKTWTVGLKPEFKKLPCPYLREQ